MPFLKRPSDFTQQEILLPPPSRRGKQEPPSPDTYQIPFFLLLIIKYFHKPVWVNSGGGGIAVLFPTFYKYKK